MKNIVRLFALTLVLAASYSAATSKVAVGFGGGGEPVPLCDPYSTPNCQLDGHQK